MTVCWGCGLPVCKCEKPQYKSVKAEPKPAGAKDTCLKCKYFDPLHFECNDQRQGLVCEEMKAEECLEMNECSTGDADHSLDYWKQRCTNAEAYIRDLDAFMATEKLRNNIP